MTRIQFTRFCIGTALVLMIFTVSVMPSLSFASQPGAGGSTWEISVIDSTNNVGLTPSLALQPTTGKPYVSYYDGTAGDLKLAFPVTAGGDCGPGNTWSCNSLYYQNTDVFALYSSIAFNSLGQWGIVYSAGFFGNGFRGIPAVGSSEIFWDKIESLDLVTGNSLAQHTSGASVVTYAAKAGLGEPTYLRLAEYTGSGGNCGDSWWSCLTLTEISGIGISDTALLISQNAPQIFYREVNERLAFASPSVPGFGNCGPGNNTWYCLVLDNTTVTDGMISVARDGVTAVTYYDATNQSLRYAHYLGSPTGNCGTGIINNYWRCITIESIGVAGGNYLNGGDLAIFAGQPLLVYYDKDDVGHGILKAAYPFDGGNCGPMVAGEYTWMCEVVDDGDGVNDVGVNPTIKIGADGLAQVAYYDRTAGDLKFARQLPPAPPEYLVFLPAITR